MQRRACRFPFDVIDEDFARGLRLSRICASADGQIAFLNDHKWSVLPFEMARYVLRKVYDVREGRSVANDWRKTLYAELSLQKRCLLIDCASPIDTQRLISGMAKDTPVKFCSLRCERTETRKRYYLRVHSQ